MTPWTVACLSLCLSGLVCLSGSSVAPLSVGFSRQEYWSGLPCPSPGDLPNPGVKPGFPALAGRFFTASGSLTWNYLEKSKIRWKEMTDNPILKITVKKGFPGWGKNFKRPRGSHSGR